MNLTIARIIAYIIGGMLLRAGLDAEIAHFIRTDPDVQMLIGAVLTAGTVAWWRLAKRFGWKT